LRGEVGDLPKGFGGRKKLWEVNLVLQIPFIRKAWIAPVGFWKARKLLGYYFSQAGLFQGR